MSDSARLQALLDQHEIEQLVFRYATGMDTPDYDLVDTVFTHDGVIDYTVFGGPRGRWRDEARSWSEGSLAAFSVRKHYLTNVVVTYADDGDSATSVTYWRSPMGIKGADGSVNLIETGGRYLDDLVRTADGWRIATRVIAQDWFAGTLPDDAARDAPSGGIV